MRVDVGSVECEVLRIAQAHDPSHIMLRGLDRSVAFCACGLFVMFSPVCLLFARIC